VIRLLLGLLLLTGCQAGEVVSPPPPPQHIAPAPSLERAPLPDPVTPRHLKLWHFDAPVVRVNVQDGALTPPADPDVLGWWGRRAGARHGATLLTGHTVHTGGGEFDTLRYTPRGSEATVSGVRYVVRRVLVMPTATFAARSGRLLDQAGPPRLVLVTCSDWNGTSYDTTTVVLLTQP
jgi:hypothetical protein